MTPAQIHALAPGDLIDGRYRIISLLAEGGMGAVFLAEHMGLSKEVALKVIHKSIAGDGEVRARFAREAMASAQIDHPHVASTLDVGALVDGSAYLVMPLVRGPSLTDVLEQGTMPWPRAVSIAAQIADALEAAHAAGIVHRDLKPDNVVLMQRDDGRDHVKVLDFGIAGVNSHVSPTGAPITRVGMVMGTAGYMAPEQAMGESVDERADLYALGVILWESIVGRSLFTGADITGIVTQQLTTVAPPIASLDANVPPELDALVARLLARSRDERPSDAGEVRDVLVASLPLVRPSLVDSLPTARESFESVLLQSNSFGLAQTHYPEASDAPPKGPRVSSLVSTMRVVSAWPRRLRFGLLALPLLGIALALSASNPPPAAKPSAARPVAVAVPEPTSDVVEMAQGSTIVERAPIVPVPVSSGGPLAAPAEPVRRVLDASIERAIAALMSLDSRPERRAAATTIVGATTIPVPEYARALARLELAPSCSERRAALESIARIGDVRALPFVARIDALPRRGCGFRNRSDCHECIRRELARVMAVLESRAAAR